MASLAMLILIVVAKLASQVLRLQQDAGYLLVDIEPLVADHTI